MKHQKKRSKSKLIIWSILILIFVTVGGFWAVGHFDSKQPTKPKTVRLTAIGDSLTYGVGDPSGKGGYTNLIRKKSEPKPAQCCYDDLKLWHFR